MCFLLTILTLIIAFLMVFFYMDHLKFLNLIMVRTDEIYFLTNFKLYYTVLLSKHSVVWQIASRVEILYFLNSSPPPPQLLTTTILFFFFSIIVYYRILSMISVLYTIGPYCLSPPFFFLFFLLLWVWFLDTSCKWNHAMFVFKMYPCCLVEYCRISLYVQSECAPLCARASSSFPIHPLLDS